MLGIIISSLVNRSLFLVSFFGEIFCIKSSFLVSFFSEISCIYLVIIFEYILVECFVLVTYHYYYSDLQLVKCFVHFIYLFDILMNSGGSLMSLYYVYNCVLYISNHV